jgi:hypothetical protein
MAKFTEEEVEDIVSEHLGKQSKVKRVEAGTAPAHDSLRPDADMGTPGLDEVRSKYLAPWRDIYEGATDTGADEIDYSAGQGDDIEDEIVQVPIAEEDETGPTKSFIVSGDKHKVIGTQG